MLDGADNLTAKSITKIEQLVTDKLKTSVLEVKQERPGVYYLIGPDGLAKKTVADPGWHNEHLGTPQDLAVFVEEHKEERSAVFYNQSQVVFVRDLNDRRDIATCILDRTPQYGWLCNPPGRMKQPDFIRMLRITLRGCIPLESGILALARNLKFNQTADGDANLQHGRQSIGKSLRAEISGETQLPEELQLHIPVFENYQMPSTVDCAIELYPAEGMLQLTPYPMEAKSAMQEALNGIEALFAKEGMPPVYQGAP